MKEIAERLNENKQIRLAKSILENAGYKVSKKKLTLSTIDASKFGSMCREAKLLHDYDKFKKIRDLYASGELDAYALISKILSYDGSGRSKEAIIELLIDYDIIEESEQVDESTGIDSLLNKVGGYRRIHNIIQDTINSSSKDEKIEGDIYGVAALTYPMVKDKVSEEEWEEIIEYVW